MTCFQRSRSRRNRAFALSGLIWLGGLALAERGIAAVFKTNQARAIRFSVEQRLFRVDANPRGSKAKPWRLLLPADRFERSVIFSSSSNTSIRSITVIQKKENKVKIVVELRDSSSALKFERAFRKGNKKELIYSPRSKTAYVRELKIENGCLTISTDRGIAGKMSRLGKTSRCAIDFDGLSIEDSLWKKLKSREKKKKANPQKALKAYKLTKRSFIPSSPPLFFPEFEKTFPLDGSLWRWRSASKLLFSSNIMQFAKGPSAMGGGLGYQGDFQRAVPLGNWRGYVEQQSLFFGDPRFDYGDLLVSMDWEHQPLPRYYLFEGGAMLFSMSKYLNARFFNTSAFAGAGTFGDFPGGGIWLANLTFDQVSADALRDSYYGQSLRLGYHGALDPFVDFQLNGTLQRVDPMIRSTPFLRGFFQASIEKQIRPEISIGVNALLGARQRPNEFSTYSTFCPFLQTRF